MAEARYDWFPFQSINADDLSFVLTPPSIIRPSKPSKSTVTHWRLTGRVSFLTWSFLCSISYEYLLEVPNSSLSMPETHVLSYTLCNIPSFGKGMAASRRERSPLRYGGPLCVSPRIQ